MVCQQTLATPPDSGAALLVAQEDLIEAVRTAVEEELLASCGNNSKRTYAQVSGVAALHRYPCASFLQMGGAGLITTCSLLCASAGIYVI